MKAKKVPKKSTKKGQPKKDGSDGKKAVLSPKKLGDSWQVSLGVEWVDGKKRNPRKQFNLYADAVEFCRAEKARRIAHGSITAGADGVRVALLLALDAKLAAGGVDLKRVEQWLAIDERMRAVGSGDLLTVGERILREAEAIKSTGTASRCLELFLVTHKPSIYKDDLRKRCGHFVRWFGTERMVSEITVDVIKLYFDPPQDKDAPSDAPLLKGPGETARRTLSAWLGWAEEKGWLPSNPCKRKRRRGVTAKKPGDAVILSTTQAASILRSAVQSEDWIVLSFLVLSLFAGVRPMEFRKKPKGAPAAYLEWSDVQLTGVCVPPRMAKTGSGRSDLPLPVLREWLEFLREKRGEFSGPILKVGKRGGGWRDHWEAFLAAHWPDPWHPDQLRHSFGSYRMAQTKNAEKVSHEMGNSPAVVLKYYYNYKTQAPQARVFWALTPRVVMADGIES